MTKKRRAKKWLWGSFWVLLVVIVTAGYAYTSYEHIQADVCTGDGNQEHQECSPHNLVVAYALRGFYWLDIHAGAFTAIATVFIAAFTLTLWRATTAHSDIHERLTQLTERQVDTAERAMTISDWPHVLVRNVFFQAPVTVHSAAWPPAAVYEYVFMARTPAILRSVQDILLFQDSLPQLSEIDLGAVYHDEIMEDGSTKADGVQMTMEMARPMEEEIFCRADSAKSYYLIGRVVFDDIFDHTHEMVFCYHADREGGRGAIAGGPAYNYRHTRKQGEPEKAGSPKEHPQPDAIQPVKPPPPSLPPGWGLVDGKPTPIPM